MVNVPYQTIQLATLLVLTLLNYPSYAISNAKEYEIKAAFLYNLGSFITWPENVFSGTNSSFQICVLGQDPFKEKLEIIAENHPILGHPVKIQRFQQIEETEGCHVLFVSDSEQLRLIAIFEWLKEKPVLTVSDIPGFTRQGGMIEFYPHRDKIRLALAPQEAINEVGLKPSAHLLRISHDARQW